MIKKLMQLSFLSILNLFTACGQQTYEQKLNSIYKNTVERVSPSELDSLRQENELVILDTRSPKEYNVSHIKGATFIDYDKFRVEQLESLDKSQKIIIYCSVGYRSERIGEGLKEAGYNNVYNLYGGIFQWKNEGYSVYNSKDQVTDSVHTYNKRWGQWLENDKGIKVTD
ncbi:MAG: rhodanese-like domain-containing protein [Nitrososphaeraceae archaeon]|nr:rhodanese-like domain-containing protein [Nitrososphaeraceae archaeon]